MDQALDHGVVDVAGAGRAQEAAVGEVEVGVDVEGEAAAGVAVAGEGAPRRRAHADGRADVATGGVGEVLLLTGEAEVPDARVEVDDPGADAAAEPAPAHQHHPVVAALLGRRPRGVVKPARDRVDGETGAFGQTHS